MSSTEIRPILLFASKNLGQKKVSITVFAAVLYYGNFYNKSLAFVVEGCLLSRVCSVPTDFLFKSVLFSFVKPTVCGALPFCR